MASGSPLACEYQRGGFRNPIWSPHWPPSRGSSLLTPRGSPPVRFLFCFCFGHAAQLVESQSYITQLLTGSNRYFGDTPSLVLMQHPPKTQPIKVWADACETHSLDKHIAVHPQNGTPATRQHERIRQITDSLRNTDESQSTVQSRRRQIPKSPCCDGSTYMRFQKRHDHRDRREVSGWQGCGWELEGGVRTARERAGVMKMFSAWMVVYICQTTSNCILLTGGFCCV